jgi:hypothetical protein
MFFVKRFLCVFELPSLRNTRKRDKTKKNRGKTDIEIFVDFFGESFRQGLFAKNIFMVFLNSPCRETPKNVLKKKSREKKSDGGWVGLGFSKCTGGSVDLFFAGPSTGTGNFPAPPAEQGAVSMRKEIRGGGNRNAPVARGANRMRGVVIGPGASCHIAYCIYCMHTAAALRCPTKVGIYAHMPHAQFKGPLEKKKKPHKVGRSLCVELRFFGLFCKNLLHVILTPPGRYPHPHDTSNPPVGRWGNCEPKWWPQGSSFCLLKNKIANTRQKEVNSTGW